MSYNADVQMRLRVLRLRSKSSIKMTKMHQAWNFASTHLFLQDQPSQQVLIQFALCEWDKHTEASDECMKSFHVSQQHRTECAVL